MKWTHARETEYTNERWTIKLGFITIGISYIARDKFCPYMHFSESGKPEYGKPSGFACTPLGGHFSFNTLEKAQEWAEKELEKTETILSEKIYISGAKDCPDHKEW